MRRVSWLVVLGGALVLGGCAPQASEEVHVGSTPTLDNGSFTATLNGVDIHYEVHGTGPVVMAVPNSWGLALDGLRCFYRPLEQYVTMVYFDQRGIGGSAPISADEDMSLATVRRDFDALRRHLGLETVHAIGWSNGAMNLILLAAEYPSTLETAVFLHAVASFGEEEMRAMVERRPEMFARYAQVQQRLEAGDLTDGEATALMKQFWVGDFFPASCADPEAMAPTLAEFYRDVEFSWPHARYTNRTTPVFDARDRLGLITARSLVVAGMHDSIPPDKVQQLADGLGSSEFILFDASGHFAPLEEPEAFRSAVLGFWGVE